MISVWGIVVFIQNTTGISKIDTIKAPEIMR